jgi:hypothetical protein
VGDRHEDARRRIEDAVLRGPGETSPELRQSVASQRGVPPDLAPLLDKIRRHPYKVTDEDIAGLRDRYTEDQLFEIIVAGVLGASLDRLHAGLRALEES